MDGRVKPGHDSLSTRRHERGDESEARTATGC